MRDERRRRRTGLCALLSCALLCLYLFTGCASQQSTAGETQKEAAAAAAAAENVTEETTAGPAEASAEAAAEPAAEETFRAVDPAEAVIGICIDHAEEDGEDEDPEDREFSAALRKALESRGFAADRILMAENSDEPDKMAAAVRGLLDGGADLLIVEPGDDEMSQAEADAAVRNVCGIAMEAHVPVIFVQQAPTPEEQARWAAMEQPATYVGAAFDARGTVQALLTETLGTKACDHDGDGTIRYLYVTQEGTAQDMLPAAYAAGLKERKIQAESKGTLRDGESLEADLQAALGQHGKSLEMIVCSDDDLAEDILETVREAGRNPGKDILILGAGAEEDLLQEIVGGAAAGTVYFDSVTESAEIAAAAVKLCALEVPASVVLDPVPVTASNAQEIRDYRNTFLK